MLRAALSCEYLNHVVSVGSCLYVGDEFPSLRDGGETSIEFAVLSIGTAEADPEWQPGFYRVDADLMEMNKVLRKLAL